MSQNETARTEAFSDGVFAIARLVSEHLDVHAITRQYAAGPILYAILIGVALLNGLACLLLSAAIAVYFLLPPRLWRRAAVPA